MHHYSDPREGTIPETWGECNSPILTFEPARTIFFQVCVFFVIASPRSRRTSPRLGGPGSLKRLKRGILFG